MPYATQQDLSARYGEEELIELSDRADPPAGVVDPVVVAQALESADAEIDGYLRARYALPLASVPGVVVEWACLIARYKLFINGAPDHVRVAYQDAIARLKDLSAGRLRLDLAGAEPAAAPDAIQVESQERLFSRDRMRGF